MGQAALAFPVRAILPALSFCGVTPHREHVMVPSEDPEAKLEY